MPGRSRLDPSRPPLTGAERSRRWRARHPKPPEEPGPPILRTFGEMAEVLLEKPSARPQFDPAAMIVVGDPPGPLPRREQFGLLPGDEPPGEKVG